MTSSSGKRRFVFSALLILLVYKLDGSLGAHEMKPESVYVDSALMKKLQNWLDNLNERDFAKILASLKSKHPESMFQSQRSNQLQLEQAASNLHPKSFPVAYTDEMLEPEDDHPVVRGLAGLDLSESEKDKSGDWNMFKKLLQRKAQNKHSWDFPLI